MLAASFCSAASKANSVMRKRPKPSQAFCFSETSHPLAMSLPLYHTYLSPCLSSQGQHREQLDHPSSCLRSQSGLARIDPIALDSPRPVSELPTPHNSPPTHHGWANHSSSRSGLNITWSARVSATGQSRLTQQSRQSARSS